MNIYDQRLDQLVDILREFKPERVYAYGSWVKGGAGEESDIDLALVVGKGVDTLDLKKKLALRLWERKYPFDLEPDVQVVARDVFDYRLSRGDPFISNIAQGRLVYGS